MENTKCCEKCFYTKNDLIHCLNISGCPCHHQKSDINTLREEFIKEYKIGDNIAEFYANKFNQKLEEIQKSIEECSDFADSGDTLKQRILQIIKNKKI